jgi:hypothetical protein
MDDNDSYRAVQIPRQALSIRQPVTRKDQNDKMVVDQAVSSEVAMVPSVSPVDLQPDVFAFPAIGEATFAEVELKPSFERSPSSSVVEHQKRSETHSHVTLKQQSETVAVAVRLAELINDRSKDPIRQTIYTMRSLGKGNPLAESDPGVFYLQAQFMQEFSDDYTEKEALSTYYPSYQKLSYGQLRTYFTWRSKVRQGIIEQASGSYVFLYVYELLANIGVADSADGLDSLTALWLGYRQYEPKLDEYLPGWLKDYHVYYSLSDGFTDFVEKHQLYRFYPEMFLALPNNEECLQLWNSLSGYDINKSRFYQDEKQEMFAQCFAYVINELGNLCASRGCHINDLLVYSISNNTVWKPFLRALFFPWLEQSDRQVVLGNLEVYSCVQNNWTMHIPIPHARRRDVIGYLIKKTELCLRQALEYRYRISVDTDAVTSALAGLFGINISCQDIDSAVQKAVSDYLNQLNRTVVTIDTQNLERIRSEASITLNRLLVPDQAAVEGSAEKKGVLPDDCITEADAISDEYPNPAADRWVLFAGSLSSVELEALCLLTAGGSNPEVDSRLSLKTLADGNGMMLEALCSAINEKAMDHIFDVLIDVGQGIAIYDDYQADVARIVGLQ